MVKKNLSCNRN